jgi:hypothetical protein
VSEKRVMPRMNCDGGPRMVVSEGTNPNLGSFVVPECLAGHTAMHMQYTTCRGPTPLIVRPLTALLAQQMSPHIPESPLPPHALFLSITTQKKRYPKSSRLVLFFPFNFRTLSFWSCSHS